MSRAVDLKIPQAEADELARLFPGERSEFRTLVENVALRCYLAGRIEELQGQKEELRAELERRGLAA